MAWRKMRFRDQLVFVRVDETGRMVLDSDGRAEMKYREGDDRTYRPSSRNLAHTTPEDLASEAEAAKAAAPRPRAKAAAKAATKGKPATKAKAAAQKTAHTRAAVAADTLHVWTDGACSGNPGPMGIGIVVYQGDKRIELGEYLGIGTNNIAELTAIERGLDLAGDISDISTTPVRVYTDSAYSIGVLSQGWKAKANQELVGRLRERLDELPGVTFVKVAGHAGVPENERCDELARTAVTTRRKVGP